MRFHYNTTPDETINFMREHAINSKAPPAMIDALDALRDLLDVPAELEQSEQAASELQNAKDDLFEELSQAAESLELAIDTIASIAKSPADALEMIDIDELRGLRRQLDFTQKALQRHKA